MKCKIKGIVSLILVFVICISVFVQTYAAKTTEADIKAEALKQLGLFKGVSDTDFDLDRAPSRVEALVMLIRLLGKEPEALNGDWTHPFTDVASWADKYVGYAYNKGLAKGISGTEFGKDTANSDMYLTFMLRALGFDDQAGDFLWNAPDVLARAALILPDGADTKNFLRSDAVLVSWAALNADMKGGRALAKELLKDGTITDAAFHSAIQFVNEKVPAPAAVSVSSFEELTEALSKGTATAVTVDSIGKPVVVTGELTIPNGVTLTINRGNDFYVEGTLTNNGTVMVMGSDAVISADFINYSVMSVQKGGKVINNGAIKLEESILGDTEDRGPVGGQLRVFDGTFVNSGSVLLEAGKVNTHGGMAVIEGGTFNNDGTVVVDGFFLRVGAGSTFNNNKGAVIINTTQIEIAEDGKFENNGVLNGNAVVR